MKSLFEKEEKEDALNQLNTKVRIFLQESGIEF